MSIGFSTSYWHRDDLIYKLIKEFKIEQNQICFGKTQTELLEQEFNQKKGKNQWKITSSSLNNVY